MKAAIESSIKAKRLDEALRHCHEGLKLDPTDSRLMSGFHTRRAKVYQLLAHQSERSRTTTGANGASDDDVHAQAHAHWRKCLHDANSACYHNADQKIAVLLKVEALQGLGRWSEASSDLEAYIGQKAERQQEQDLLRLLQKARFLVKKSQRVCVYKLLGIPNGGPHTTDTEIKKAYKKSALKFHPDRQKTEAEKPIAEKRFKEIGEANELLMDPTTRRLWDEGYDQEEIKQRVEMMKQQGYR
eukprot:FR737176.1.p1 GENE.FR737176.1~~FR737176.1.p1  ORF type:complete len:250 (+),score=25.10 FR737176.1:22-750(+)